METRDTESNPEWDKKLLKELNQQIGAEVSDRIAVLRAANAERVLPAPDSYPLVRVKDHIAGIVEAAGYDRDILKLGPPTIRKGDQVEGVDLAFNAAGLAKKAGKKPVEVAEELAETITQDEGVADVKTVGPFVNISLDYTELARETVEGVAAAGDSYGESRDGESRDVLIDYSSPNIAKNMTAAHLRSTVIGESLSAIHEATGDMVLRINHIGDWGTQFGGVVYQYEQELAEHGEAFQAEFDAAPTDTMLRIYQKFTKAAEADESLKAIAQEKFLSLEQGNPEFLEQWSEFRQWSIEGFLRVYKRLDVEFDAMQGESFYEDMMDSVVEEGLAAGVLKVNEEGAVVFPGQELIEPMTGRVDGSAMLQKDGKALKDEVIRKPSGGTVYLTRDLAAIKYRIQELGMDKILYVIGKEQREHCLMLFNMAEQIGYITRGQAEHISFGHLNQGGKKMSSRGGGVVLLDPLLTEAHNGAKALLEARRDDAKTAIRTDDEEKTAEEIGVGSIIFNDLSQDRQMDINFDPKKAVQIESGRLPYVQYTHARLASIERRLPDELAEPDFSNLSNEEKGIVFKLAAYPEAVRNAAEKNLPHYVATYLSELCQDLNHFYQSHPVLKESGATQATRARIISAARQVISNAADLLHVTVPDRM